MLSLLWCLQAHAGVDEAGLNRMIGELAMRMRAVTGAVLSPLPPGRVKTTEMLIAEHRVAYGEESAARYAERVAAGVMGLYDPDRGDITLVVDNFRAALTESEVPPDEVEPVVRCVVAHELVHAAQHERGVNFGSSRWDAYQALQEGQADALAEAFCPARVREFVRALHGVDMLGSREPTDLVFTYGYGARFVEAWERRFGQGSAWSLLGRSGPPLQRADIEAVAMDGFPRGWRTWDAPARVAQQLLPEVPVPGTETVTPHSLLSASWDLRADAGQTLRVSGADAELHVYAWAMSRVESARLWVGIRRNAMVGQSSFRALMKLGAKVTVPAELSLHLPEADSSVRVRVGSDKDRYEEVWACKGHMLVGIAMRARKVPPLEDALRLLLAGPEPGADPKPAAEAVFARFGPAAW